MQRTRRARTVALVLAPLAAFTLAACAPAPAPGPGGDPLAAWRPWINCVIDHESRSAGTYWTNTGNGYYGAFQFAFGTWSGAAERAGFGQYAGTPPVAPQVPPEVQDAVAVQLATERGDQPWGNRCVGALP